MAEYPLLFGYRDLVAGNGYLAGVAADGRALLVDEDGDAWVYGVNPGGVCANGKNHGAATAAFRESYRSVLFDIAADAATFEEFKAGVERFFDETNRPTEEAWKEAVRAVRAGEVTLDWLARRPADESPCRIAVALIAVPKAENNQLDKEAVAA